VRVQARLSFNATRSKQIDLDERGCSLRDRTSVTCLPLTLCMEYDGDGADEVIGECMHITMMQAEFAIRTIC